MIFNNKYLTLFFILVAYPIWAVNVQSNNNYISLDSDDPINFFGSAITYNNDTILLGKKAFFIDGQLSDSVVAQYPFVFNSINKAVAHLTNGDEKEPMVMYIAPYVYWIDNPDDPEIRKPVNGSGPYGLRIQCEWLTFFGLNQNAENVVLACNRGQTMGSKGNFTMMRIIGQGTSARNITFGNYCNVDLKFPLKPDLERAKRGEAIVQAQLVHCNGDKIFVQNARFISRLNSNPFIGAKRALFDRCHFECTDDALGGTAVYLNSSFDFYSSKPFYHTRGTGAVFLNCDINSLNNGEQYFTKANGQLAVIDTRFVSKSDKYLSWRDYPPFEMRNYQSNVTLNGQSVMISKNTPYATVEIDAKPLFNAYRFEYNGSIYYNTYNLLSGDDNWDPMGIKDVLKEAEGANGIKLHPIPVQMRIEADHKIIETGVDTSHLTIRANYFGNYKAQIEKVNWTVASEHANMVELKEGASNQECILIPKNNTVSAITVVVKAYSTIGLEAACELLVKPKIQEAPKISDPKISFDKNKKALVIGYQLKSIYKDETEISWYRCSDREGNDPIQVEVSRFGNPHKGYQLCRADVGYYIMAKLRPKHVCSYLGEEIAVVFPKKITINDVPTNQKIIDTDFMTLSTADQPRVLPGFWTFDHIDPMDVGSHYIDSRKRDAWYVGMGSGGSVHHTGLLQSGRSGLMLYTPVGQSFNDMACSIKVLPFKTAGQGFSVAPLYMDVLIKFDNKNKSGYALRLTRTINYSNAVECYFVKYENGQATKISPSVATSAYRPTCIINLKVYGQVLSAQIRNEDPNFEEKRTSVLSEVSMKTAIEKSDLGGFGIFYNGGSSAMIKKVKILWE